ncbi:hypothetical protein Tco_1466574 [Tanacetum coccineum]
MNRTESTASAGKDLAGRRKAEGSSLNMGVAVTALAAASRAVPRVCAQGSDDVPPSTSIPSDNKSRLELERDDEMRCGRGDNDLYCRHAIMWDLLVYVAVVLMGIEENEIVFEPEEGLFFNLVDVGILICLKSGGVGSVLYWEVASFVVIKWLSVAGSWRTSPYPLFSSTSCKKMLKLTNWRLKWIGGWEYDMCLMG